MAYATGYLDVMLGRMQRHGTIHGSATIRNSQSCPSFLNKHKFVVHRLGATASRRVVGIHVVDELSSEQSWLRVGMAFMIDV